MKIDYIEFNKPIYTTNPNNTACEHIRFNVIICDKIPFNLDIGTAINIKTKEVL